MTIAPGRHEHCLEPLAARIPQGVRPSVDLLLPLTVMAGVCGPNQSLRIETAVEELRLGESSDRTRPVVVLSFYSQRHPYVASALPSLAADRGMTFIRLPVSLATIAAASERLSRLTESELAVVRGSIWQRRWNREQHLLLHRLGSVFSVALAASRSVQERQTPYVTKPWPLALVSLRRDHAETSARLRTFVDRACLGVEAHAGRAVGVPSVDAVRDVSVQSSDAVDALASPNPGADLAACARAVRDAYYRFEALLSSPDSPG